MLKVPPTWRSLGEERQRLGDLQGEASDCPQDRESGVWGPLHEKNRSMRAPRVEGQGPLGTPKGDGG